MRTIFKNAKTNAFINEEKFFRQLRTIFKNWETYLGFPPRLKKILEYRFDLKDNYGNFLSRKEISRKFKIHIRTAVSLEHKALELLEKD